MSEPAVSVDRDPKNRSYTNSGVSIRNLSNKELLAGLVKLDRALNIQTGGVLIHLLQIRSQQHLTFPMSIYHYSESAISNVLPVEGLTMDITLYITSEMTMQYMCGARNTENTYNFHETISSTYTMWVSMK